MVRGRSGLLCLLALCGCGGEPRPAAVVVSPAAAPTETPRARRPATAQATPDVDAFVSAWRGAADSDDDSRRRAEDALLAAGPDAVERLLMAARGDDFQFAIDAQRLIPRFGAAAIAPLAKSVASEDESMRHLAMHLLGEMASDWAYGDDGPAVCRALVARLAVEGDASPAAEALKASLPAGRAVAAELAEIWRAAADGRKGEIASVLAALGPDAAKAAPVFWAAVGEGAGASFEALHVLASIAVADSSKLELLGKLLDDGSSPVRAEVVELLGAYGDAAAPLVPRLVARLGDDESDVGERAWRVLAAMSSLDDATWRAFVVHGRCDELAERAKDPKFAARLAKTLPTLDAIGMESVYYALVECGTFDLTSLTDTLLHHPFPSARLLALESRPAAAPIPKGVLDLLEDPDPGVRLEAAFQFAHRGAVPGDRLRAIAAPLCASGDAGVRAEAVRLLSRIGDEKDAGLLVAALTDASPRVRSTAIRELPSDVAARPDVCAILVQAASDPDSTVAEAALGALMRQEEPPAATRAVILEKLVADVVRSPTSSDAVRLREIAGGAEALAAAVAPTLASGNAAEYWRFRDAVAAAALAAPQVPTIRPTLARLRESVDDSRRLRVDEALAQIDFAAAVDPEAIALGSGADDEKVRRLLALGDAGRAALPLAASASRRRSKFRKLVAEVPLKSTLNAAADVAGADDRAKSLRKGAALLAPLLPDADAIAVLAKVVDDEDARSVAAASLVEVETRSPGAVPVVLVGRLLRGAAGERVWSGLTLLELVHARAGALVDDVVPDLRELRDGGGASRARAVVALWRLLHRGDETLPTLRAVLAHPERIDEGLPWGAIGSALSEMPLEDADVAAIVATVQRAASLCEPPEMNEDSVQPGDAVVGSLAALLPVLERLGPRAAPAVPALRIILSRWDAGTDEGAAAVRCLAAIGSAARAAIPELRRAARRWDPHDAAAEALRRIESAAR
jgi:HEAT repeat protein